MPLKFSGKNQKILFVNVCALFVLRRPIIFCFIFCSSSQQENHNLLQLHPHTQSAKDLNYPRGTVPQDTTEECLAAEALRIYICQTFDGHLSALLCRVLMKCNHQPIRAIIGYNYYGVLILSTHVSILHLGSLRFASLWPPEILDMSPAVGTNLIRILICISY